MLACAPYLFVFIKTNSDAERTGFQGAIYADPTRSVYHALGMNIERLATTPANQKKRSYIHTHTVSNIFSSIGVPTIRSIDLFQCTNRAWQHALVNPGLIGKQGNISQLGGEFVMGPGKHPLSSLLFNS